ncbi:hypothetical protein [Vibrio mediterranei]|uniref:hypothetical protein n=1 Tax=Vibrio mediterranei TaxID=689 RepID=UPI0040677A83
MLNNIFLQATRIVARKGIELGIDLIDTISKQREEGCYLDSLKEKAKNCNVELLFINDWVGHSRGEKEGQKVYSLWDVYSHADIITYPSLLEGWGNQFLEGLVAKVPMAVYRYPVFDLDIADYGFDIIDLGNKHQVNQQGLAIIDPDTLQSAVDAAVRFLFDTESRRSRMEQNYHIGEKHLSYSALKAMLSNIFQEVR